MIRIGEMTYRGGSYEQQNFTLLVFVSIVVLFVWRVVSGSRRKQEIDREEREFNRAEMVPGV